jgi:hypothetical protein
MLTLLLVRSFADIPFALRSVNEFLAYRRSENRTERDDEALAICLKEDLDAGLPIWHWVDRESGRTPIGTARADWLVPAGAGLGIRASFSLSGISVLCWVDGSLLNAEWSSPFSERTNPPSPSKRKSARSRPWYPRLIGSSWYHDDKTLGIVAVRTSMIC